MSVCTLLNSLPSIFSNTPQAVTSVKVNLRYEPCSLLTEPTVSNP